MKEITRFLLFLSVLVLFLLTGCSKEKVADVVNTSQQPNADKMHRMLTNFRTEIKSSLKDGQVMTIDSTIWYMEASLNETYARTVNNTEQYVVDSATSIVLLAAPNTALLTDIATAYQSLTDSLSVFYNSISGEKQVSLLDINVLSVTSDTLRIMMTEYISTDPVPNSGSNWTFGSTDYWIWGNGGGKCTTPGFNGLDAATQITSYANNSLPYGGSTYYFSNITSTDWIFPENVPAATPNPFGYFQEMLFHTSNSWSAGPEPTECLSPNAMNFYLYNIKQIALMTQYNPTAKPVANYYVKSEYGFSSDGWIHMHKARVTYGYPVVGVDPPQEP